MSDIIFYFPSITTTKSLLCVSCVWFYEKVRKIQSLFSEITLNEGGSKSWKRCLKNCRFDSQQDILWSLLRTLNTRTNKTELDREAVVFSCLVVKVREILTADRSNGDRKLIGGESGTGPSPRTVLMRTTEEKHLFLPLLRTFIRKCFTIKETETSETFLRTH